MRELAHKKPERAFSRSALESPRTRAVTAVSTPTVSENSQPPGSILPA
jgi:hypothetical protein